MDGPVPGKIQCFPSTTSMKVALPCQQINWALEEVGVDGEGTETCRWVRNKEEKTLSKTAK